MRILAILFIAGLMTGCATTQQPISMEDNFLITGEKVVGIALTQIPEPDVYLPGANCLLCLATAETANASLSRHTKTLQPDDFKLIKSELVQKFKSRV